MKNFIKHIIGILTIVLLITSCDNTMDINTNPNYPEDTSVDMLLPSAEISFAGILGGDMQLVGSLWSQHYTQNSSANQYNTTVNYTISNTSYARFWSIPYTATIPDLKNISEKALEQKAENYYMVSEIMTCFVYHILSSWYENVPYTEAATGEDNLSPKYDNGESINEALITRLDKVLANAESAAKSSIVVMNNEDFIFKGNIEKWERFGNSLKLKLMLQNFNKYKSELTTLVESDKLLNCDCKLDVFSDKENNSNPLYENDRRKLNTPNNLAASSTLLNFLQANNDPRIEVLYTKNSEGKFFGLNQGDRPPTASIPSRQISKAVIMPEDPVYLMSFAELCFMKAEIYARIGNAANAKTEYEKGVNAAFSRWVLNDVRLDGSKFIAADGAYKFDSSSEEAMLKCILTQKWIAAARCQAWDSYFDINRTGYPALGSKLVTDAGYVSGELAPVVDSALLPEEFPKRMIYPKNSSDNNSNAPTPISITTKQWWHK